MDARDQDLTAPSPKGEGTDWGMLKIFGGLFAARQRGVEDGAAARGVEARLVLMQAHDPAAVTRAAGL